MSLFKGTETCPLYKEGKWVKTYGYSTPGGGPVYHCSRCGGDMHTYSIECQNRKTFCEECGSRNFYPGEKNEKEGI